MMMDAQAPTFISTHTPHARRDIALQSRTQHRMISTHTPHARRDLLSFPAARLFVISTHTPHARRDVSGGRAALRKMNFYSHASCEA